MSRQYRKFDADFKHGAVQLVFETGKPIAQVAPELGINEGTLGNCCVGERRRRQNGNAALSEDERAELVPLSRVALRAADAACSPQALGGPLGRRGDGPVAVA